MAADLRLRDSEQIQGDIIAGFKKDNVTLLFLKFEDVPLARAWLRDLAPKIATTRRVAEFNKAFSAAKQSSGGDDPKSLKATWLNVSLTYPGLAALVTTDPLPNPPAGSGLEAFKQGSAARAGALGDIMESRPDRWLFGNGTTQAVHAVLTVASDTVDGLNTALREQREAATQAKIVVVFQQDGTTLPGTRASKEHFGFKDGISEPGVRFFDEPDPANNEEVAGKPGTRIVPAGEFVIGEEPAPGSSTDFPAWAKNGSFQVIRRLGQDVPGWWAQVSVMLKELKGSKAIPQDADSDWLAARLVGRWRSGAPVCKNPNFDPHDPKAAKDNDFDYDPQGPTADPDGLLTPLFSHLRKTSPRAGLDAPKPGIRVTAKQLDGRRIMRRGLPYGAAFDPASEGPDSGPDAKRGLLFICYQTDLVRQFEFIQTDWIDKADFPPGRDPVPGEDPAVGHNPESDRTAHTGTINWESRENGGRKTTPVNFKQFVRTEGSVYAFVPSINTLKLLGDGRLTGEVQPDTGTVSDKGQRPGKAYPCDEFVAVPDQQRKGGQSQYWAFHGNQSRQISVADGSAHTDRAIAGDSPLTTWTCLQGVGRVDCWLPMPDLQNPSGKSWYWVFHTTGGKQQYRAVSITCSGFTTSAVERPDRDLTAWGSLSGVGQVDCWLPVADQQRVGGKSWYWVFHTTGGRQRYRMVSIADGNAHTDVCERTDREISQWGSLNGLNRVDCFLPVPDQQRVGGKSEYWAFSGQNYRRISIADGSGHPDQLVSGDRSCDAWASLV
ncbi:Dyp-type peroxidase [Kitasatospora aureofaciens]|uniref:Dyp-type peroxidase n=1 Tax=Kitasatospora aureofaciens TaxID=1894 RepID=UPI001C43FBF4|nr:Dyp-type peroxidase [Kitasatospora aureofaciens]MBV6695975.1 Dyp-type peroxidase [Kitasatospora aureofaciens]